ncbi:MAG: CBM35 domain-containing protein [Bacteroidota bacterium]
MKTPFLNFQARSFLRSRLRLLTCLALLLIASGLRAADITVEAEAASMNGVFVATDPAGYSGTGFVWGFDDGADSLVFTIPATAGKYKLSIQYYSPFGDKKSNLFVNGVFSEQNMLNTGSAFDTLEVGEFDLVTGDNNITIKAGWGWYGIDKITLTPVAPSTDLKLEGESASMNGLFVATDPAGYSGTGFVWGFDEGTDSLVFTVPATAGKYKLSIKYYSPFGDKKSNLFINGVFSEQNMLNTGSAFDTLEVGEINLVNGNNTITFKAGWGWYGIDYILLTPVPPPAGIKLEGEDASFRGVFLDTNTPGFSGTGYVWGFDDVADSLVFNFPVDKAGKYDLIVQYNSPFGEKHFNLSVNGSAFTDQTLTNTGWDFGSLTIGQYDLVEGQNTIVINNGWGWYGIDFIALVPVIDSPPVLVPMVDGKAEAEDAVLSGVLVDTNPAGYSGTGQVVGFDNATDKVTFNFNITPGLYNITIAYHSPWGDKGYDLQVNDEKGGGMFTGTGDVYGTVNAGKYLMKDGINTIVIAKGWGYYGVDYIQLTPTTAALPVKPPKHLVDSLASSATRSLFSYLVDLYGNKVLAGQQGEMEYVFEKTGKEPALGGFDFMDYSPSRQEHGASSNETEIIIDWAKKGNGNGIVSMMWHWNAPTDLIDTVGYEWWRGFYTFATTFDLAAALADKNSERYHLIIRDIDSISVQLKKYQTAGIPILWRPLHEAAGTWFWWGAKGPEAFKELWHIMYDRMTNYHQLHNLIWVYTATTDMNWYPGDQYVDIVGLDIYTDPTSNMSGEWGAMQNLFGGNKLVTLSETGNVPNADKIRGFATWWSWFTEWAGLVKQQPDDVLNAIYHDEDVLTRDELPNWYIYGQANVAITEPTAQGNFYAGQPMALKATATDADGTVKKVSFWIDGQLVGVDTDAQDGWEISWTGAVVGAHTIMAQATDNEGIVATSAPVTFTLKTYVCQASGTILREVWTNLDGSQITDIPVLSQPNLTNQITSLQAPANYGDRFGQRLRGYICAPQTGAYTFWIVSDNDAQLSLSTDADPAHKQTIAFIKNGYAFPGQWTKYPSQKSATVNLVAGQRYYLEALHKEEFGGDNLIIGWRTPASAANATPVIVPGSVLSPFVPVVVTACAGSGSILREYWANVKGDAISNIPVNTTPSSTSLVTTFEGPTNVADKYAARYRGYLCAPISGQYRFAIAGDNEVELWLSTSESAAGKQKIAFISGGHTNPREWTKYATQKSALVTLQAGQKYYIEALHKEATGGDNLSVSWQQPGSATFFVIPGANLVPFQAANAREASLEEVIGLQAYPNPFTSELTVNFTTTVAGQASLDLYDLRGVRVQPLFEQEVQAGESHKVFVKANALQNGLYLIKLVNGNQVSHIKVMLTK